MIDSTDRSIVFVVVVDDDVFVVLCGCSFGDGG